jgi:hypothetical protein
MRRRSSMRGSCSQSTYLIVSTARRSITTKTASCVFVKSRSDIIRWGLEVVMMMMADESRIIIKVEVWKETLRTPFSKTCSILWDTREDKQETKRTDQVSSWYEDIHNLLLTPWCLYFSLMPKLFDFSESVERLSICYEGITRKQAQINRDGGLP